MDSQLRRKVFTYQVPARCPRPSGALHWKWRKCGCLTPSACGPPRGRYRIWPSARTAAACSWRLLGESARTAGFRW